MRAFRYGAIRTGVLLGFMCVAGCKVSDDALAASEQMTHTAVDLRAYYGALADAVGDTIALYELDGAISGVPFNDADRKLPEEARAGLLKRRKMAEELTELAASMAKLVHSKATADVETAATALGNELVQVKALPGGSPIPEAMGKAGSLLLQVVQQRDEKRAAEAMDQTLAAMAELFAKEKPTYDSIARTHLREASQVAKDLTSANGVDVTPMLEPALKPFLLSPLPADRNLQGSLRQLALARLDAKVEQATDREMDGSAAMLAALQEMSARVHTLATEHHMGLRGAPFSLTVVEGWLAAVS